MSNYNFAELDKVVAGWKANAKETTRYNFHEPKSNNIVLTTGSTEMLRVAEDGFYIRGEKVPVDDKEAATVYNAFKEFLVWNRLSRE